MDDYRSAPPDIDPQSAADASSDNQLSMLLANARSATDLLKALSHEARLIILCQLTDGEKTVTELAGILGLRQPAVSQQLARLRADDLVGTRRDGKNIYYSLARADVREVIFALHKVFCVAPAKVAESARKR